MRATSFNALSIMLITTLIALVVVAFPGTAASDIPIADPVQWTADDGGNEHWYRVSPREVEGMDDATELAATTTWLGQPGYVVSILSESEKDFLVEAFGDEVQYVIGYTDEEAEGVWKWVSGEPSGFTFWASGEPNNHMDEDFAVTNWQHDMQSEPEPPGSWNDLGGANGYAIFEYEVLAVDIDVKPDTDDNTIGSKAKGVLPVAVLTTDNFDASTVHEEMVRFGPGGAAIAHKRAHVVDVDSDGDLDLLLHFRVQETGLVPGDTEACLSGYTFAGTPLQGCDAIRLVPAD